MQPSQQSKALSLDQFVALLERKSVIPGVLSLDEVSNFAAKKFMTEIVVTFAI